MVEIITSRGVRIPFHPEIVTPPIERPLRKGKYEGGECLAVDAAVRAGDRVLELGTGLGLVSTRAALVEGVAEVLTFEANPALIPLIRETHALNGVADRIRVVNGVVTRGDAPATLPFYRRADFWASSLTPRPGGWVDEVVVETHDFDALLAQMQPTVIIADIEGGELDLFEGADLSSARYVIMEIHPRVYGAEGVKRIFDAMSAQGFGYAPKISRGGTVVTFERVGAPAVARVSGFDAAPAPTEGPRVFTPTCMKNEGPFILEWLAWHRVIGVTDVMVFTNDCADGSDALLDRLDALGVLRHLPNPAVAAGSPRFQPFALAFAADTPQYRAADYVLSMDVDEFVNIHVGDGTVDALVKAAGRPDAISLSEANFANDGREEFAPGFVTEQFTRCGTFTPGPRRARRGVKTLFRPASGLILKNHRPVAPEGVGYDGVDWRDGSGRPAPRPFIEGGEKGMDCRGAYGLATLNHYPLRSMESFLLKRDRGDVVVADRQVSRRYWRVRNLAEVEDRSLLRRLPAAKAEYARLIADAEVARLHAATIDWHRARIAALRAEPDYAAFLGEIRSTA